MSTERLYLGVDVGTGSARAAVFDAKGTMRGMGTHPIRTERPAEDFVEQSSDDIWSACGVAVRAALEVAGVGAESIAGVGFDATCSLVVLDAHDRPVTVSPTGDDTWNVVVWMDHRATALAARINATEHEVLRYVGGVVSPEMQTPKLLWLKENLPGTWRRAARFLDLPDFLVYRATGADVRSLCTTVCKWTYLGHDGRGWQRGFFDAVGLGELADEGFARIGTDVRPMGERAGVLTNRSARELGLAEGTPVAVAIIDAHAGGLGTLGAALEGGATTPAGLESRLALIGGTSSCHMAVAREPRFVPGVWGPYFSAMVPGMWLAEGGQSATGALVDHVIASHARGAELEADARARRTTVYALLNERLDVLAAAAAFPAALTRDLHVLPDHHGNRSPRADPTLRGMVSGLKLTESLDALALVYLATVQAVAHGTRHIVDVLRAHGYPLDTILACGGGTKNDVFLREHADATGCRVVLPAEPEAVLLGAAVLGAVASGDRPSIVEAMPEMTRAGRTIEPTRGDVARFHDAKHAVFLRMHDDQLAYREMMHG
ncbi:MAG TPA: FGGY-family carbohydrate kinase [Polyangiaceae bacterium]|jgi:FGGY-family pentulose kinase|nr:FGGY-family carbohydrate kinase [Polyangiaceae bacterium]